MSSLSKVLAATALCSVVAGVSAAKAGSGGSPCDGVPKLTCFLSPTGSATLEGSPSNVTGFALFTPEVKSGCSSEPDYCAARINGTISGLGDETPHGWHIHEFGDVSTSDGSGTGGHFNPLEVDHALPTEGGGNVRHAGDLRNLIPDAAGVASFNNVLDIDLESVRGRGLIVHAVEDDGGQPTGNAGARLAQCVLGVAK